MVTTRMLHDIMAAFIAIDTVIVGARFGVRFKMKTVGHDDYVIAVGLLGFIFMCTACFQSLAAGFGLTDPADIAKFKGYNTPSATRYFTIAQLTYLSAFPIVRLSIALVLLRIAKEGMPRTRRMLIASMAFICVYSVGCIIIDALQCIPLRAAWDGSQGKCLSFTQLASLGYAVSALDIASSLFYSTLPVFMLNGVQIGFRTKFAILFLLSLGASTVVISIMRLRSLVMVVHASSRASIMKLELEAFTYSVLEFGVAILTASLVALRPMVKYLPFGGIRGRSSYGRKHPSAYGGVSSHMPVSRSHGLELSDRSNPSEVPEGPWQGSDSDSQRDILSSGKPDEEAGVDDGLKVWKQSRVEVSFEGRQQGR